MWSQRIRFLLTISCVLLASPLHVSGQGYGGLADDDGPQQFGGGQFGGGAAPGVAPGGFPNNQQISALPQYESAEQGSRQGPGFNQPPYNLSGVAGGSPYVAPGQVPAVGGAGGSPYVAPGQALAVGGVGGSPYVAPGQAPAVGGVGGSPYVAPGQAPGAAGGVGAGAYGAPGQAPAAAGGAGGAGAANLWWQGQNAFQRPPGHPGVEQLAPSGQPAYQGGPATPAYNPYGGGAYTTGAPGALPGLSQTTTYRPPPVPTQSTYNPGPLAPAPPVPQEPNVQPFPNQPPIAQITPSSDPYRSPPTPPPQQPPVQGLGWNAPSASPAPSQNYYPQGTGSSNLGQPPVEEAPGCTLVNKADCHNNRRNFNNLPAPVPPPQNYQPPAQFQQPQQPSYQPPQYQPPVPAPNLGYQPPPPQAPTSRPYTPAPYKPPQAPAPRPNAPYQSNSLSSPNAQRPRPQPQQPQTPKPYTPRPRPQQSQDNSAPYPGCPAAMKCVQDEYCNAIGLIEDAPIQFSAADRLHRVGLMQCSEPMSGIVGVCCRDPNYKDPWPATKTPGQHHHPAKGHSQGQSSFQPPQSNHLQSGNPYSGIKVNNKDEQSADANTKLTTTTTGFNDIKKLPNNFQHHISPLSSPNLTSESKQTLQVLELCSQDELCLSMSQCHSLNPQFMAKTGLNPATKHLNNFHSSSNKPLNDDHEEPLKIKRCKYERSGIHYLCCKKPSYETPIPSTSSAPPTTSFHFTPFKFSAPTGTTSVFSSFSPSATTTTKSSLVTGVGLRFHSGLHSQKQQDINSRKPNPYGENEAPIQLNSPRETTFSTTPSPFAFQHNRPFRFTTTTTTTTTPVPPVLTTKSDNFQRGSFTFSPRPTQAPASVFARVISTSRTHFSTTTFPPPTTIGVTATTARPTTTHTIGFLHSSRTSTGHHSSVTTPSPSTESTTTEGKVDIYKIPVPVTLSPELKADPPIGFIFKGEDLYIPDLDIPSQNYLVPLNDFEPRTLPPLEEQEDATASEEDAGGLTTAGGGDNHGGEVQDSHLNEQTKLKDTSRNNVFKHKNPFLHNNSIEGTIIYSILEESSRESAAG